VAAVAKSCGDLVTDLYREVLWRDPDPQGLEGYTALLMSGKLSGERLREILLTSEEYKNVVQHRARNFSEAASDYQRQSPWSSLPRRSPIKVECGKYPGTWYVVLGGDGGQPDLTVYESLSTLRSSGNGSGAAIHNDGLSRFTTLNLANQKAIAHREYGVIHPPAWEMELIGGCLRAIPEFIRRRKPGDTSRETVRVPGPSGELTLVLSWIDDSEGRPSADFSALIHHNVPSKLPADELRTLWVTVENRGTRAWRRQPASAPPQPPAGHRPERAVQLLVDLDGIRRATLELPHDVNVGERATFHWVFRTPNAPGRYVFKLELAEREGATFEERGVPPLRIGFEVFQEPPTVTSRMRDRALATVTRLWMPSESISWSQSAPGYPIFAREAKGYRITDVDGRQYTDLLMGWGASLLGYANDRIRKAIGDALHSGAVLSLTHELEIEVGEMLTKALPGAELVLFGKNGSDVCSAAVRIARLHTRRPIILVCGYHGFQDWYAERYGFAGTGVPEREKPYILPFQLNNLESVERLFQENRGQVAAVMLEAAGPFEDHNGPVPDADRNFLSEMAALARREGAVVIFDEIMTGFRYPGGSVQRATGVIPDLTCLGKGLSAGMPLSAVVGKKEIFDSSIGQIFYGPTFRGEVYSLAAAREALTIYQERDVPARITGFGTRLKEEANRIFRELRAPAEMIGPPFRMVISYKEADRRRLTLMRTLVQQELYKEGILTCMNLFVPCDAHDDQALAETCRGLERAIGVLVKALEEDCFARYLEIPPILT
jgi:glutamate-1-semialdehyde 2,1-aminomutase